MCLSYRKHRFDPKLRSSGRTKPLKVVPRPKKTQKKHHYTAKKSKHASNCFNFAHNWCGGNLVVNFTTQCEQLSKNHTFTPKLWKNFCHSSSSNYSSNTRKWQKITKCRGHEVVRQVRSAHPESCFQPSSEGAGPRWAVFGMSSCARRLVRDLTSRYRRSKSIKQRALQLTLARAHPQPTTREFSRLA